MAQSKEMSRRRLRLWSERRTLRGVAVLLVLPVLVAALIGIVPDASARSGAGADGKFDRRDSFHFTLYQDVALDEYGGFNGSRRFERELLKQLESAYSQLDRILGLRPDRKLVVYVWDPVIFEREFSGLFRFPAAGFYGGSIHVRGATSVTSNLIRVLHHEMVHAAFDAEAPGVVLPAWMNEGFAEWFEARALGKRGLSPYERHVLEDAAKAGQLFSLEELSVPTLAGFPTNAAGLAYLESYGFITYLADAHGENKLVQFWSALLKSRSLERASRRAFGRDFQDLEAKYFGSLGVR